MRSTKSITMQFYCLQWDNCLLLKDTITVGHSIVNTYCILDGQFPIHIQFASKELRGQPNEGFFLPKVSLTLAVNCYLDFLSWVGLFQTLILPGFFLALVPGKRKYFLHSKEDFASPGVRNFSFFSSEGNLCYENFPQENVAFCHFCLKTH